MKKSHRRIMPFERGSSRPALLLLVAAAVANATAAGIVKADVLYDTTDMTDNQTYDEGYTTFIGGEDVFGNPKDVQAADDFTIVSTYEITTVTFDYTAIPGLPPADGVLVEFFSDSKGVPDEVPIAAVLSTKFTATPYEDTVFNAFGLRLTIDLSGEGITLAPGTWWLSITPVDAGVFWVNAMTSGDFGNNTHLRDGGIDHANGFPGLFGVDDWTLVSSASAEPDGDLAMKIEGTPVKPPCPADLDDSGDIGVKDLLFLLGAWGPCPKKGDCPADFDNSGDVGVKDLLFLLGNWGPCP